MKTLLIAASCLTSLALTSFGQSPAASPVTSPAGSPTFGASPPSLGMTPAGTTMSPGLPAASPATTGVPPTAVPPTGPAVPPAPGISPAVPGATVDPLAVPPVPPSTMSPPVTLTPAESPAAVPGLHEFKPTGNAIVDNFIKGGWIMWPILIVSIIALAVVLERICWWTARWFRRDPKRVEKVFTAIETGDVAEASRLARGSRDPVLRMLWNGLNHQHASLQGALQVAAGIEIKRAGRFLVVMDTLVTLAPLLGLLGTITGLMKSFGYLGNEELAVQAVTGGIAEALIATACGLGIAIFALVPFNFFTSRVSNLEFELQTAATNLEVMLESNAKAKREVEMSTTPERSRV